MADAVAPRQPLVGRIAVERVEIARRTPRCPRCRGKSLRRSGAGRCGARSRRSRAADIPGGTARPRRSCRCMRISALCTSDTALVASTVVPGAMVSTSSRCTVGALNTSGLPTYIGCLRPGSVSRMLRPKPISRPFGFLRTTPPAAMVSTCKPPAASEHRGAGVEHRAGQIDLPRHLDAAVVDVQAGAGDGDAVIALQRLADRAGWRRDRRESRCPPMAVGSSSCSRLA